MVIGGWISNLSSSSSRSRLRFFSLCSFLCFFFLCLSFFRFLSFLCRRSLSSLSLLDPLLLLEPDLPPIAEWLGIERLVRKFGPSEGFERTDEIYAPFVVYRRRMRWRAPGLPRSMATGRSTQRREM